MNVALNLPTAIASALVRSALFAVRRIVRRRPRQRDPTCAELRRLSVHLKRDIGLEPDWRE